jgi:hypothetical protein
MIRFLSAAIFCLFAIVLPHTASAQVSGACPAAASVVNTTSDATPVLRACLASLPPGATLPLKPGRYLLLSSLVIPKPVTIETASSSGATCSKTSGANCAMLSPGRMMPVGPIVAPIQVQAANVQFRSMAIVGDASRAGDWATRTCANPKARPQGGLIRVAGDNFRLTDALLKNASCYTALEVAAGIKAPQITGNRIGPNGTHSIKGMWSDGVTIHDSTNAVVKNNVFIDNTDVQLIFGGCRNCSIEGNRFRHSGSFSQASFAELMIQAWPTTSGDYSGTTTSGNDIDCGASRRCGYGLMIGGAPWYPVPTSGGSIVDNRVKNAQMGLNIDKLSGPMTVDRNMVSASGGLAKSDCGAKQWPAVNVSPASRRFLQTTSLTGGSVETRGCLLNRQQ